MAQPFWLRRVPVTMCYTEIKKSMYLVSGILLFRYQMKIYSKFHDKIVLIDYESNISLHPLNKNVKKSIIIYSIEIWH